MSWVIGGILMVGVGVLAYVLLDIGGKIEEISHHDEEHDEHETGWV